MHDLNTIIRRNEAQHGREITLARAAGKWVVAHYEGLHLISHQTYTEPPVVASGTGDGSGGRVFVLAPLSADEAAAVRGRDQSEDRAPREVDPAPANYVRVDEEYDEIHVYDCTHEVSNVFEGDTRRNRRAAAERFGRETAARLGCDWGTNYA